MRSACVVALAAGLLGAPAVRASILVRYSFDDDRIETGPDTFTVFERAKGRVRLATAYRTSGFRSVEVRDAAADGDFPELQGYFAARREGKIYVHFAFLVADPSEELNIALAGPGWFQLGPDGIAFWLTTRNGVLAHISNSITKKLVSLRRFVWYRVDLTYDVDRGIYDLEVAEEHKVEPIVRLQRQPNAASQPGSAVDKFSFIGDLLDRSQVHYFVDDVVIGTDASVKQLPFVAPGRRKLFFDVFAGAQREMANRIGCLPALDLDDFGIAPDAARAFVIRNADELAAALGAQPPPDEEPPAAEIGPEDAQALEALAQWSRGCQALEAGGADTALGHFEAAIANAPSSHLYAASAVLALAAAGRSEDAESRWSGMESAWRSDPRYPVVRAVLGRARGSWDVAESWLRRAATEAALLGDPPTAADAHVAEQYFYALLWTDRAREAELYAVAMAERFDASGAPSADWLERAGDVAVYASDLTTAISRYERALGLEPGRASLLLKLSDLHFLRGDLELERIYREKIFGTLR